MKNIGQTNSIDVLSERISLDGKFVIDAGCGAMTFSQQLIEQGASVLAIDPDSVQAELNRAAEPVDNLKFHETGAEKLPADNGTVDGVIFSFSLHHVPAKLYPDVFKEVHRVLKEDGFLCVIEPAPCPMNEILKLFHNEDREREAAQQALIDLAIPKFETSEDLTYHSFVKYESFEQYADRYASKSFNSLYTAEDVRSPEVETAFEAHAPDYKFISPKRTMILQSPLR